MKAGIGQHGTNREDSTFSSFPVVNCIYYLGDLSLLNLPRGQGPSLVKGAVVRVNRVVASENCLSERKPLINGSSVFFLKMNSFYLALNQ